MKPIVTFVLICTASILTLCAFVPPPADDASKSKSAEAGKAPEFKGDPYALDLCIICSEKLNANGTPVVTRIDDREVRFCCGNCAKKFESDKEAGFKALDEKLTEAQLAHYPLKTCVVMAEDSLEAEGAEPVNYIYRNRLVRLCCKGCVRDFNKDPNAYIAKLNEAVIKQQKDAYPLQTCVVGGEKLGSMGEPVNYVIGTTLVRFCCAHCTGAFEKDPTKYLTKVHDAWRAKHADHAHEHGAQGH
jgi:YHS domain-containing protein